VEHYKGVFPNNYDELLKLPGVGPYTAAAVGSFAFDLPHAVVDGNVYRVLSRYFDIDIPIDSTQGKKEFAHLAQQLLDLKNPAQHNQAIMEFGALVCTPKKATCENCPLNNSCLSLKNQTVYDRPMKSKKNTIRNRYFHFLLVENNGKLLVQKRIGKDIWENMYQLPLVELEEKDDTPHEKHLHLSDIASEPIVSYTHQLSHQKITASFWKTASDKGIEVFENTEWVQREELNDIPLPRLIDRFFEQFGG
jgi:A/G-specific adenine glycosylase